MYMIILHFVVTQMQGAQIKGILCWLKVGEELGRALLNGKRFSSNMTSLEI